MPSTRALSYTALVLGILAYRSGPLLRNCILFKSSFPTGYIAGGNYTTDCTTLKALDGSDDLKYCEDAALWELHDGEKVEHPLLVSCDSGRKSWNTVMGPLIDPKPRGTLWYYNPHSSSASEAPSNATPIGIRKAAATLLENIRGKKTTESPIVGGGPKAQRITLKNYPEGHDFHPLGLEIYPSHSGASSNLYVVNHGGERTTIEQFVVSPVDPTTATYIRTITSPYFISPNALALTGPDSFYVTNDHLITRRLPIVGKFLPILETILALPLGFVSHVTLAPPSSADPILSQTVAAPFIPFANGVALSPSGLQVAIASTSLGQVFLYARDPLTNALTQCTHTIPMPFTPDNLRFFSEDEILVGGHPHFPSLINVAANTTGAFAPSWVASLRLRAAGDGLGDAEGGFDVLAPISASAKVGLGKAWVVETLFQSDGSAEGFQSSTTGLRDPRTGNVYVPGLYADEGVLVCRPGSA